MEAIYYKEHYYLLPKSFKCYNDFYNHLKSSALDGQYLLFEMEEDYKITGPVQKGVSFAPYFISGYNVNPQSVTIHNINEVYPAEIEILSQDEYNALLRSTIESFCTGCIFYKPLTKNIRSLNGHFNEISLDKLCFIRQESKPSPRYFIHMLRFFGGYFTDHGELDGKDCEWIRSELKNHFYIKYDKAEYSHDLSNLLILSHKKDVLTKILTEAINDYMTRWMYKTKLRISDSDQSIITEKDIDDILSLKNAPAFMKDCKKYGISIAVLEFDKGAVDEINSSLSNEIKSNLFYPIIQLDNKIYYLMTDSPSCLKALHFRHPMLQAKNAKITVHSQWGVKKYTISRYMPCETV